MKILIEDIGTTPTEVDFVEAMPGLNALLTHNGEADYHLHSPLHVSAVHVRSGEDLSFTGTLQGELIGRCARCAEDYPLPLVREFSLVLTPQRTIGGREVELSRAELSASFYSGETVDLSALVQEQTLLALPSLPLCSDACRGLCVHCGANLNLAPCECRPAPQNPRLTVLSTLRLARSGATR